MTTRTMVYKYAVIKGELPDAVIDEIRLAHRLRNDLVAIDKAHQERIAEIWAAHPDYAAALEHVESAGAVVAELLQQAADHRKRTRQKKIPDELAAAVKAARSDLAAAKTSAKQLKTLLYPEIKQQLQAARADRHAAVKATYPDYVGQGLYWASINEVRASHETSAKRIIALRSAGRPADFRFHRWDGSGTIAVQLQRAATDQPRSPELLASGAGKWSNVATIRPGAAADRIGRRGRKAGQDSLVTMRIGSGDAQQIVELPVRIHRPMPPDADVAMILLTRRRVGSRFEAAVSIVVKVPAPEPRTEGALVAAHLGWRKLDDGAIRAAVIIGTPATGPAPDLDGWLRSHDGWAEVTVPAAWQESWSHLDGVRSVRDKTLEVLKEWLLDQTRQHPDLKDVLDPDGTLAKWRSPLRFAGLARRLHPFTCTQCHRVFVPPADAEGCPAHPGVPLRRIPLACPPGVQPQVWEQITTRLEAWRKQDKHLWDLEAGGRQRLVNSRRGAYQKIAAWALADAATLIADEWSVAEVTRKPRAEDEDDRQAERARANRAAAAPGMLRQVMRGAAEARGVRLPAADLTAYAVHSGCGGGLTDRAEAFMARCEACGRMVDQDVNAARLLAAAARGETLGAAS